MNRHHGSGLSQTTVVCGGRGHAYCCQSQVATSAELGGAPRSQDPLTFAMIALPLATLAFFFAFLLSMPAFAFSLCRFLCLGVSAE